jgi:hypothetical protein
MNTTHFIGTIRGNAIELDQPSGRDEEDASCRAAARFADAFRRTSQQSI